MTSKKIKDTGSLLVILILLATCFGCLGEEPTGVNAIEFRLVAVDGDGREKSVFKVGERIGITVKFINHSREDVNLTTPLGCWIYQFEQFTVLYRCGETESVRKAMRNTIVCRILLPQTYTYPARSEGLALIHYWDENPENEPLPAGTYCSSIKGEGFIDGVPVKVDTKVSFEVR